MKPLPVSSCSVWWSAPIGRVELLASLWDLSGWRPVAELAARHSNGKGSPLSGMSALTALVPHAPVLSVYHCCCVFVLVAQCSAPGCHLTGVDAHLFAPQSPASFR